MNCSPYNNPINKTYFSTAVARRYQQEICTSLFLFQGIGIECCALKFIFFYFFSRWTGTECCARKFVLFFFLFPGTGQGLNIVLFLPFQIPCLQCYAMMLFSLDVKMFP
jgi:hypothetical protein